MLIKANFIQQYLTPEIKVTLIRIFASCEHHMNRTAPLTSQPRHCTSADNVTMLRTRSCKNTRFWGRPFTFLPLWECRS